MTIKMVDKLILLIGSNPLPNFIVPLMLKPKQIRGYFSQQTKDVWGRLKMELMKKLSLSEKAFDGVQLANSNDPLEMERNLGETADWHLNYTGGTKTMSAHYFKLFLEQNGGDKSKVSYLDDHDPKDACLRFGNGRTEAILIDLDVESLAAIHGFNVKAENSVERPTDDQIRMIADFLVKNPEKAKDYYEAFNWENADNPKVSNGESKSQKRAEIKKSQLAAIQSEGFLFPELADKWELHDFRKKWCKILSGNWLEMWIESLLKPHFQKPGSLRSGQRFVLPADEKRDCFELDVVILKQHRLFTISCTTDAQTGQCKSKAFEITFRTRQLGGDLARPALACFLGNTKCNEEIKKRLSSGWDSPIKIEVWGIETLQNWLEDSEKGRTPTELTKWLDQEAS